MKLDKFLALFFLNRIALTAARARMIVVLLSVAWGVSACSKPDSTADDTIAPVPVETAEQVGQPAARTAPQGSPANTDTIAGEYKTIEWTDLIPQDDLDALLSPPDYLDEIEDGSEDDQLPSQTQNVVADERNAVNANNVNSESDDRYQQALTSKRIIPEFNGQKIRIPGFIVPLEFDDEMTVTEFFLVPYFGACIHLPPPPPNQVIHATFAQGIQVQELYDPFWITGTLRTQIVENDTATAAYTLEATSIAFYDE